MRTGNEEVIFQKYGQYILYKMRKLGIDTLEQCEEQLKKEKEERQLKKDIGYREYNRFKEFKESGLSLEDYFKEKARIKVQRRKEGHDKHHERDKIRFRTIRFFERHCTLERKCQICGKFAEIHHPNYNDYLKVNLLCKEHHTRLHNFELIPPPVIDLMDFYIKKKEVEQDANKRELLDN